MLGFNSGVEMNLCLSSLSQQRGFGDCFFHSFAHVNAGKTEGIGFPGTPKPGLCDLNEGMDII